MIPIVEKKNELCIPMESIGNPLEVEVNHKKVLVVDHKGDVFVNNRKRFTNKALRNALWSLIKIMKAKYK